MRKTRKASRRIRDGNEALDRIMEAGELFSPLIDVKADKVVLSTCMDLELEAIEIGWELLDQQDGHVVRKWLEPKRDIITAYLQQRGLDKTEDAQYAFLKIEAVLRWVGRWEQNESEEDDVGA